MISVAVMALEPGMELAEDVVSDKVGTILAAHTILDALSISKLELHNIMCVTVMEPEDYATTYYEKVALSRAFSEFKEIYNENLNKYKGMIITFIEGSAPLDTKQLLSIYHSIADSVKDNDLLLDMLYSLLPNEDNTTYAHCLNAALIAGAFAEWLSKTPEETDLMILCGFLYDIGKVKLPNKILWKAGKLNNFEFNWMKTHTTIGYDLLKTQPLNPHILNAALMHHERADGSGYPLKIMGNQIDPYAQYMAIVDSYDAMTSARSYRPSLNPFKVIANFERSGLYQYDMAAVRTILTHIAALQIGRTVILSDDRKAIVRMVSNDNTLSRPIIETEDGFIDLKTTPNLEITSIL